MARQPFRVKLSLVLVALLVWFAGGLALQAERIEDLPQPQNYISDFAHVLSPATEQRLNLLCSQVDHQANAQIAVVTIHTLDGMDTSDYAVRLEEKWKVGPKGSDRGILMLFAIDDHKRWITVGYGLEGILPDGKVGDIGRNMVPYLRQNNFDAAITLGVAQIAQIIAADAGVTLTAAPRGAGEPQVVHPLSLGQMLLGLLFLIFVVVFLARAGGGGLLGFLLGMLLGGGGGGGRGRGGWGGGGYGGGGWGGGGGGGGFGGFGGGSSGGGGAGGDW